MLPSSAIVSIFVSSDLNVFFEKLGLTMVSPSFSKNTLRSDETKMETIAEDGNISQKKIFQST